jgi:hypothetical protein
MTAWLSKGDPLDTLRGFAIYQSDSATGSVATRPAYRFIAYDPVAEFTVLNDVAEHNGRPHYYFVTAISRTNVESDPITIVLTNFVLN